MGSRTGRSALATRSSGSGSGSPEPAPAAPDRRPHRARPARRRNRRPASDLGGLAPARPGVGLSGAAGLLFFDRQLGGWNDLEPLVGDRLSALDGEAVGAGCEA